MRIYRGSTIQRGYGIGSIFKAIFRFLVPLFKKASPILKTAGKSLAKKAGKAVLKSGANVLANAIKGEKIENSFKKELQKTRDNVSNSLKRKVNHILNAGREDSTNKKRSKVEDTRLKKNKIKRLYIKGTVNNLRNKDIFG